MRVREQLLDKRCELYEAALRGMADGQEIDPVRVLERAQRRFPITEKDAGAMEVIRNLYTRLCQSKRRTRFQDRLLDNYRRERVEFDEKVAKLLADYQEAQYLLDLQEQQYYDTKRERDALQAKLNEASERSAQADTLRFIVWPQHPEKTQLLRELLAITQALLVGEKLRDAAWMKTAMKNLRRVWANNEEFLKSFSTL